jgi:hypothetical protein
VRIIVDLVTRPLEQRIEVPQSRLPMARAGVGRQRGSFAEFMPIPRLAYGGRGIGLFICWQNLSALAMLAE